MADPIEQIAQWWQRGNGAIVAGLILGTAAKYGLTMNEGKRVTLRGVVADLLILGMLMLIAVTIADWLALTGNNRVLAGALAAVSSDRLIRLARDRFLQQARAQLGAAATAAPGGAFVPAGRGEPEDIRVHPPTPDSDLARTGAALRAGYRQSTRQRPPADMTETLRQLPDD